MRRLRHSRAHDDGATLLEFVIVAPVILLLMFTMIDMSLIIVGNSVGGNAAREGARVGIIDFDCADSYPGGRPGHLGQSGAPCPSPSPQYLAIDAAVRRLLGNLVRGNLVVNVRCLDADDLQPKDCRQGIGFVEVGRDLIEVSFRWEHIGASPFVRNTVHSERARMVIQGKPLPRPPTPTTTSTSSTTTTPSSTTTTIVPRPRRTSLEMVDKNANGRIDQVVATFDAALPGACNQGWSLAGTPSGGTLANVTIAGTTATLTINEGAGAPDTAVGPFRVSFSPQGGCTAEGFASVPPSDKAGPVPVGITSTNRGQVAGKMESGDELAITFSEDVTGVPGTSTVTETDQAGNGPDQYSINGVTNGQHSTGSDNYVTKNNKSASFDATILASGPKITVQLTGSCSGDCDALGAGMGVLQYTPASSLKDAAGNPAAGSYTTPSTSFQLF